MASRDTTPTGPDWLAPPTPAAPVVVFVNATMVTIAWPATLSSSTFDAVTTGSSSRRGQENRAYDVEYAVGAVNESYARLAHVQASEPRLITLSGLTPLTSYRFRVRAVSATSFGSFSDDVVATTEEYVGAATVHGPPTTDHRH